MLVKGTPDDEYTYTTFSTTNDLVELVNDGCFFIRR